MTYYLYKLNYNNIIAELISIFEYISFLVYSVCSVHAIFFEMVCKQHKNSETIITIF